MKDVLVLDSASILQFVLERMLKKEGFRIHYTKTPRDFTEQAKALLPDLVFLEAEISGGKGLRICEYMRRSAELAHIPIILTTRIVDTAKHDFGSWPGVVGLLRKPLASSRLLELVNSLDIPEKTGLNMFEDESQAV